MNRVIKFFHELMNPHCEHCAEQLETEREEAKFCPTCEALSMQLSIANQRITSLLNKEVEPQVTEQPRQQVIQTRATPFHVIRQRLEAESRAKLAEKQAEAISNLSAAKPDSETKPEEKDALTTQLDNLEDALGIKEG
jgi:hypothetical protein